MHHQPHNSLPSHGVLLHLPQPSLFSDTSTDAVSNVQNLIVHQVRPITYEPAVEASLGTSDIPINNRWRDSLVCQINQTKINNPLRCEVCKIDFNSKTVLVNHISGKKHKKNMQLPNNPSNAILSGTSNVNFQIQDDSVQGQGVFIDAGSDLKSKKRKLSSRGETEYDDQVDLTSNNGIGQKKIKVAQPAECEICMVSCNSKDVYIKHLSGKKHLRNLEKVSKSKSDGASTGANASVAGITATIVAANDEQLAPNPDIESQEKSVTNKQECAKSYRPENVVILEAPEKDTEMKKRKHELEGGTSITSTKFCTPSDVNNENVFNLPDYPAQCEICMVNCNSKPAYVNHISGKRHKRNLDKVSKFKNDGAGASVAGAIAAVMMTNDMHQAIEPKEMGETSPQERMDTHNSGNVIMLEASEKDIETERHKIEPFGGAATTSFNGGAATISFKVCKLCNVPCNSEATFNSHLHGKKHAAMVKKMAMSKSSGWF